MKIRTIFKIETLSLVEANDGFWLYDNTLGMNLAMRCKDEQSAYIEALLYYQNRLLISEKELKEINNKVDAFVSQFTNEKYINNK